MTTTHWEEFEAMVSGLSPEQLDQVLARLPQPYLDALAQILPAPKQELEPLRGGAPLPHQVPPTGDDWQGWVLTGGRGIGKTFTGARFIAHYARSTPGLRGRIIAPTLSDAVNGVVLDPDSGILAADPTAELRRSGVEGVRVEWPNGSTVWCVGTHSPSDVDRLRALTNIDVDLFEEAAANRQLAAAAEQAALSRRGKRLPHPVWAATTTPRPVATFKAWLEDPAIVVTRATTHDNPYTPDEYRTYAEKLRGTRLYRQEILGEVVEDVEGALWRLSDIERSMIPTADRPAALAQIKRVAVGVDPPAGAGTCGIVVVGLGEDRHLYVLADYSVTDSTPSVWANAAVRAALDARELVPQASVEIVAETNQGGRMVKETLQRVQDPSGEAPVPLAFVNAAVGKRTRAEPISVLWEAEEQLAHYAPSAPDALAGLTSELTEWVPGESPSPDHLDAMVWACHRLLTGGRATLYSSSPAPASARSRSMRAVRGGSLARR